MMILRTVLAASAALTFAAGCTAQDSERPETTPPLPELACGAGKVSHFIDVVMNDDVMSKIKVASGAKHFRVLGPRDAMTMDYRPDRMTITTDESGRIKTIRCV